MLRQRKYTPLLAEASEEIMAARHQQQDEDFCRALRAAIYSGAESCPLGVSTEPGTKKPIWNYHPPES
jgi:hypothetical protein